MKHLQLILICRCLVCGTLAVTPTYTVQATDFEGKESEYYEKCKSSDLSRDDIQVCSEFKDYISEQNDALEDQIKENEQKIAELDLQIDEVVQMIGELSTQIEAQEEKIAFMEADIANLEAGIEEKNEKIRDRLYVMQSTINSNVYFNFLMGAESLDDFFGRLASIDEITSYDRELIASLKADKEAVEVEKASAEEERSKLAELKSQQEALGEQLEAQRTEYNEQIEAAHEQSEEFKQEMEAMQDAIDEASRQNGDNLGGSTNNPLGFGQPVSSGTVTSAGWFYVSLNQSPHLGMDIGAPIGTELYAPANGVVIYMYTGCPTSGSGYGDTCGGGAGNALIMLTQVDGITYAVKYYHMKNENLLGWTSGSFIPVSRGQLVGHVGHSGSSTGAHVHIEVINLGAVTYAQGARMFSSGGYSFGTGTGYTGYNNRCSVKGSAPCREMASEMFGYQLYQRIG